MGVGSVACTRGECDGHENGKELIIYEGVMGGWGEVCDQVRLEVVEGNY